MSLSLAGSLEPTILSTSSRKIYSSSWLLLISLHRWYSNPIWTLFLNSRHNSSSLEHFLPHCPGNANPAQECKPSMPTQNHHFLLWCSPSQWIILSKSFSFQLPFSHTSTNNNLVTASFLQISPFLYSHTIALVKFSFLFPRLLAASDLASVSLHTVARGVVQGARALNQLCAITYGSILNFFVSFFL